MKSPAETIRHRCDIRPADGDDAGSLSSLAMRSKMYWGYDEEFMNLCRGELTWSARQILDPHFDFQSCHMGDEIVAFYALERIDDRLTELAALFVEPRRIGVGIGSLMIEHAMVRAASWGATRLLIEGDPHAESFYLSTGAVPCGSRESGSVPGRRLPLYELAIDRPSGDMETGK